MYIKKWFFYLIQFLINIKKMYKESLNSYLAKTQLNKKQKTLFRKLLALLHLERIEKVDINKPFKW